MVDNDDAVDEKDDGGNVETTPIKIMMMMMMMMSGFLLTTVFFELSKKGFQPMLMTILKMPLVDNPAQPKYTPDACSARTSGKFSTGRLAVTLF